MAGTDRVIPLSAPTCPRCGYFLPAAKAWTTLTVAEHALHELEHDRLVRAERGEPDTRSDVEARLAATQRVVAELRAARSADRGRYLDVSARRYDLAQRVAVLEALATWEVTL